MRYWTFISWEVLVERVTVGVSFQVPTSLFQTDDQLGDLPSRGLFMSLTLARYLNYGLAMHTNLPKLGLIRPGERPLSCFLTIDSLAITRLEPAPVLTPPSPSPPLLLPWLLLLPQCRCHCLLGVVCPGFQDAQVSRRQSIAAFHFPGRTVICFYHSRVLLFLGERAFSHRPHQTSDRGEKKERKEVKKRPQKGPMGFS